MAARKIHLFDHLVQVMDELRLRCPWDREQTFESLKAHLLEETYEVLDAIDRMNPESLREELGDLLIQVVFLARLAREKDYFRIDDVVSALTDKLVRRHPHVFGDEKAENPEQALANWNRMKQKERIEKRQSVLEGIPAALPALLQAQRLGEKAGRAGFDWHRPEDVMAKVEEEWRELKDAMQRGNAAEIEHEMGDLLFSMASLARFLKVNAEEALRQTLRRFTDRFMKMEDLLRAQGRSIMDAGPEELDQLWEQIKRS